MAWLKKKNDPITERARALNAEIAALEDQIRRLDSQSQHNQANQPKLRSTAVPHGVTITHAAPNAPAPETPSPQEPIFEEVNQERLTSRAEPVATTPEHFNELGVRKYDLPALLRRIGNFFHGPTTSNPKLVSYLAAGGVQGLRPLRKEKRIARNRFIAFTIFLFLMLMGIIFMAVRNR